MSDYSDAGMLMRREKRIAELEAELAEAKKDAERLRCWYAKSMSVLIKPIMTYEEWIAELDAAVYAAREEKK